MAKGVYALLDPVTGIIAYIGQSKNISKRYSQHVKSCANKALKSWICRLSNAGMSPDMIILEESDSPVDAEKHWIDRAKAAGIVLFNIHEGGRYPSHAHAEKKAKIWRADGVGSPYLNMRMALSGYINLKKRIHALFEQLSKERKSKKTEEQILDFEIKMAWIAYSSGYDDLRDMAVRWVCAVEGKVNAKYPGKLQVRYENG